MWRTMRHCFAICLLFLLAGLAQAANRFAARGEERPNFLLLLSDDQTHRALSRMGELGETV